LFFQVKLRGQTRSSCFEKLSWDYRNPLVSRAFALEIAKNYLLKRERGGENKKEEEKERGGREAREGKEKENGYFFNGLRFFMEFYIRFYLGV
jgi:hypothetical protein